MIDLHAHVLPALDDGPRSLAISLAQARAAVAAGVTVLVATPHVDHTYGLTPAHIRAEVAALRGALAAEAIPLEVIPGGEVALARAPELDDAFLAGVALGGGPWVLLEIPFTASADTLEPTVEDLRARGFEVLLAHPERAPVIQREPERLARLIDAGALAQVTAGSLIGHFGERVRGLALALVRDGLVQVIASDTHGPVERPPAAPGLDALPELEGLLPWLCDEVPGAILAGAPVPERPILRA